MGEYFCGSLLDDLKVNGVGKNALIWYNVMVDPLVKQLAIQRNLVPCSSIKTPINDTEAYRRYFRGLEQTVTTIAVGISR